MRADLPWAVDEDADGNWKLSGGDIQFVGGARAVAVTARQALALRLGTYVIDLDLGLDWQLGVTPNIAKMRADVMRLAGAVPFVASVDRCDVTFDKTTRTLHVSYHLTTTTRETVEGEDIISV